MTTATPHAQTQSAAPTAHAGPIKALAERLAQIASAHDDHQIALAALISAYAAVATANPCCARLSADMARTLADFIETDSAAVAAQPN